MEETNPLAVKPSTLKDKLALASSVMSAASQSIAETTGIVKPIEYYSNYKFTDPKDAVRFMQSDNFTGFWDRTNAGKENIGVRAELNDSRRYNTPKLKETYTQALERHKASYTKGLTVSADAQAKGLGFSPKEVYDKRLAYNLAKERSVGRFYTDLSAQNSVDDVAYYLNRANSPVEEGSYPIRVIADKRYSGFSLAGRQPYDGLIDLGSGSHEGRMNARRGLDLSRKTGTDLGSALSSNPRSESFVSSSLARPASDGGASRLAGRVNATDGVITVVGKPRVPINTQVMADILPFMGQSMAKAAPVLGAIGTGVMAYQGYQDYNSDNRNTREYGRTDPFGVRAGYDLGFDILSGTHTIPQAWESQRKLVADPEYQMRNPLAATLYNTAHGNFELIKAFAGGYVPSFLK